ncbi:ATP-binding cassette domain-containing protein [Rhodopseudomonas palustris]|uniref:ABC transporter ATP-binding protein n=1 Tax=Rhodopseudomonas palustris TaxID=1076 RepID=UPI0021F26F4E|nr:ATP-binding cassette domain-containing protein [Rhodopseudomonas palustris]UYO45717.1 ATP-binding cassette domain-containing protein [Rhodopseudomonas palustris]
MSGPRLIVKALHVFHQRIEVVFGVDLDLAAGEVALVLGANGAGKSSLLGALAGLVRSRGEVTLGSRRIDGMPARLRAEAGLAFVPERRGNVFAPLTVNENLDIGLRLLPRCRRPAARDRLLELFPILRERGHAQAGALSGGEQQMLAIAMALGREPSVLVLDEPSQGLAPVIFDHLERAFAILKSDGLALLVAEQNLPFAAQIADRYVVLSHGLRTGEGGRADLARTDLLDAYLGE